MGRVKLVIVKKYCCTITFFFKKYYYLIIKRKEKLLEVYTVITKLLCNQTNTSTVHCPSNSKVAGDCFENECLVIGMN